MTVAVFALGVACAVRGLWSPCGLSMLSTMTPLGERARGHTYGWSLCWYLLGATTGGACLGACLLIGSEASSALGVHGGEVASIATVLVVVACLAGDARLGRIRFPERPRQVNEHWVERFRPWAYASGFGWQIGTGLATYVMTDALYALVVAAALLCSPLSALAVGIAFGAVRGACLLVGSSVSTPDALRGLHVRLARLAPWSIAAPAGAELVVLLVVAARRGGLALLAPIALVGCTLVIAVLRHSRRTATASVVTP